MATGRRRCRPGRVAPPSCTPIPATAARPGLGHGSPSPGRTASPTAAARQAAAVAAAAQRIRHLTIGLRASRQPLAAPRAHRVVGPAGHAVAVAGPPPGRRRRQRPRRRRRAHTDADRCPAQQRGATDAASSRSVGPQRRAGGDIARRAHRGRQPLPDPPALPDAEADILDALRDPASVAQLAGGLRERAFDVLSVVTADERRAAELARSLDDEPDTSIDILGGLRERAPETTCRPLSDLVAFADSIAAGIDPTAPHPVIVDRVLRGSPVCGRRSSPNPTWRPRSTSRCGGSSPTTLPTGSSPAPATSRADRVLAVETNPTFIDALLIGANVQTLGELRWRNLPDHDALDAAAALLATHRRREGEGRSGHPVRGLAAHRHADCGPTPACSATSATWPIRPTGRTSSSCCTPSCSVATRRRSCTSPRTPAAP